MVSVTDKLVPEDGEEAKQEGAAVSGKQRAETVHKTAEGEMLCLNSGFHGSREFWQCLVALPFPWLWS